MKPDVSFLLVPQIQRWRLVDSQSVQGLFLWYIQDGIVRRLVIVALFSMAYLAIPFHVQPEGTQGVTRLAHKARRGSEDVSKWWISCVANRLYYRKYDASNISSLRCSGCLPSWNMPQPSPKIDPDFFKAYIPVSISSHRYPPNFQSQSDTSYTISSPRNQRWSQHLSPTRCHGMGNPLWWPRSPTTCPPSQAVK